MEVELHSVLVNTRFFKSEVGGLRLVSVLERCALLVIEELRRFSERSSDTLDLSILEFSLLVLLFLEKISMESPVRAVDGCTAL